MKIKWVVFLSSALSLSTFAGDAFLRIQSDSANSGAQIFINGTFKGECPLDVSVEAGRLEIVAVKTVDAEYEQRWSQTLSMGDGAIKRIQVQLSAPALTEEALRARQVATYQQTKASATAGNSEAMVALANLYEQGIGTERNPEQAQLWREKAARAKEAERAQENLVLAQNGDIPAMERMAIRYDEGNGVEKSPTQAELWRNKHRIAQEKKDEALRKQKQKDEAEQVRIDLQEELDSISYIKNAKALTEGWYRNYTPHLGEVTFCVIPTGLLGMPIDLISTPTKFTKKKRLSKQLEMNAAAWGNPESMMGKADKTASKRRVANETFSRWKNNEN